MAHDVKEAREAIAEVVDNEKLLSAICLSSDQGLQRGLTDGQESSEQHSYAKRVAAALLQSYEHQVQSVEGGLRVRFYFFSGFRL